jgi:RNAse (barnase) inhibitor barstar
MNIIELKAQDWRTWEDFYGALLVALGAPNEHGRNLNALIDSIVWGGMNAVEPPYKIIILGVEDLSKDIRDEIHALKEGLTRARAERLASGERDVEIALEIKS